MNEHKTWLEIASKAEAVGIYGYTQKDADIFNSYPFKFLCEKVDQLEEQLEVTRLAIKLLRIPKEDK